MAEESTSRKPFSLLVLRAVARWLARMPIERMLAVGRCLGWFFGKVLRYHRRDAFDALRRSFPEKSEPELRAIVRDMYRNFGMNLVESLRLAGGNDDQVASRVSVVGEEHVKTALARGKGALILTAHFGNWDLLSVITPRKGYPLTIITKDVKNEALNEFWMATRRKHGLSLVPAHQSYRVCRAALKRNELVGFILDQNMIDKEGVFVDFFGRPACTTPGLAFMAAQSGAPIVPAFITRREGGYHEVRVLPPIDPPRDREPATIQAATQEYTRIIEKAIRERPEQWIWIHRRWRTRRPDEKIAGAQNVFGSGDVETG
ncbi:MAG: lysophospholipid acyltransferase family protein [Kiritimatiellae bacterium]|nr:lysophospholipid acyltransferase family protein [Kiritimatiellia bacterium]